MSQGDGYAMAQPPKKESTSAEAAEAHAEARAKAEAQVEATKQLRAAERARKAQQEADEQAAQLRREALINASPAQKEAVRALRAALETDRPYIVDEDNRAIHIGDMQQLYNVLQYRLGNAETELWPCLQTDLNDNSYAAPLDLPPAAASALTATFDDTQFAVSDSYCTTSVEPPCGGRAWRGPLRAVCGQRLAETGRAAGGERQARILVRRDPRHADTRTLLAQSSGRQQSAATIGVRGGDNEETSPHRCSHERLFSQYPAADRCLDSGER